MTIHAVLVCFAIAAAGTNESDRAPRDRDAGRGSGPTTPMKPTTTAGMGRERRLRTTVPIGHAVSCRTPNYVSAQRSPSFNSCCLPQPGILPQVRYPAKTANIFRSTSCSRSPRWCVTASLINHKSRSPVADLAFFYLLASPE